MSAILSYLADKYAEVIAPKVVSFIRRLVRPLTRRARISLGLAAGLLALLLLFGPSAHLHIRVAWGASGIPMSSRTASTVQATLEHLNSRVVTALLEDAGERVSARGMAEAMTAVHGLASEDRSLVASVLTQAADSACGCWPFPRDRNHSPHTASTAWSLYALAQFDTAPPVGTVDFLLSAQQPSGAWPLHRASEFGSTYATAVALLALQVLVEDDLISIQQQVRAKRAIGKGHDWLVSRQVPRQARWLDYPNARTGEPLPSISGLVMFTLHQVQRKDLDELDRAWLQSLPSRPPRWDAVDTSRDLQVIAEHGDVPDSIVFTQWPWLVLGTVAAYPNGNVREQAAALRWLEHAVAKTGLDQANFESRESAPEFLMALRELGSTLSGRREVP